MLKEEETVEVRRTCKNKRNPVPPQTKVAVLLGKRSATVRGYSTFEITLHIRYSEAGAAFPLL